VPRLQEEGRGVVGGESGISILGLSSGERVEMEAGWRSLRRVSENCEGAEGSAEISEISGKAVAGRNIREREVRILIINYVNKQINRIKTVVKTILQ